MKVRIDYTIDVPDEVRRSIRAHYGQEGLASRDDLKQWYRQYGESEDENLAWAADYRDQLEKKETA